MRGRNAPGGWLTRGKLLAVAGAAAALAVAPVMVPGAVVAAQGLPFEPTEEQLEEAVTTHHPEIAAEGLPEGHKVWFIIDAEMEVLETGVDEADGLADRLRELYPEITTEFDLELSHITVFGQAIEILWMVPEPPEPGGG